MAGTGNLLFKRGTLVPTEGLLLKGMPAVQLQGLSTPVNSNGSFGGDFAGNNYENRLWVGMDSYGCSYVNPISLAGSGEFTNTPYPYTGQPALVCGDLPTQQGKRPIWMGAEIRAQKSVKTSTVYIKSILVTAGNATPQSSETRSTITIVHDTLLSAVANSDSFTITDTKISTEESITNISSDASGIFTVTHTPFDTTAVINDIVHIRNCTNPIFNSTWMVSSVINATSFTVNSGNSGTFANKTSTGGFVNKTPSVEYPSGSLNSINKWYENSGSASTTTTTFGDSGSFNVYYLMLNSYAVVGVLTKSNVNYKIRSISSNSNSSVSVVLGPLSSLITGTFTAGSTVNISSVTADGYNVTSENNLQFNREYTVSTWNATSKTLVLIPTSSTTFFTGIVPNPYGIAGKILVKSSQNTDSPIILKADWNNPSDLVLATQQTIAYAPNRLYSANDVASSTIALNAKKYVELKSPDNLAATVVLTLDPSSLSAAGQFLKVTSYTAGTPGTATIGFLSAFTGDPESPANYALLNEEGAERGTQTFKSKIRIDEELIINGTEIQSLNDGVEYNSAVISSLAEDAYLFNETVSDISIGGEASVISIGNPGTNGCSVIIYDELTVEGELIAQLIDGGSF